MPLTSSTEWTKKAKSPAKSKTQVKAKKSAKSASNSSSSQISIDFPQEGETLWNPYYCVRVGTTLSGSVEISIDGGDWQPCRESVGYWWFDWTASAGEHTLQARIASNGKTKKSKTCTCVFPA